VAQAARDLDVHENVLRKWVREASADPHHAFPGQGVRKPEQAEIERLRKEVAKLKMERDIQKKPQPTLPGTRCEVRVRCEAPRRLVGGDVVRGDRCLAKRLLRMAAETPERCDVFQGLRLGSALARTRRNPGDSLRIEPHEARPHAKQALRHGVTELGGLMGLPQQLFCLSVANTAPAHWLNAAKVVPACSIGGAYRIDELRQRGLLRGGTTIGLGVLPNGGHNRPMSRLAAYIHCCKAKEALRPPGWLYAFLYLQFV